MMRVVTAETIFVLCGIFESIQIDTTCAGPGARPLDNI